MRAVGKWGDEGGRGEQEQEVDSLGRFFEDHARMEGRKAGHGLDDIFFSLSLFFPIRVVFGMWCIRPPTDKQTDRQTDVHG